MSLRNRSLRQGNLSLSEALYLGAGWALAVVALPVSLVPGSANCDWMCSLRWPWSAPELVRSVIGCGAAVGNGHNADSPPRVTDRCSGDVFWERSERRTF